jgi:hypothetical protein
MSHHHIQWKEAVAGAISGALTVLLLHPLVRICLDKLADDAWMRQELEHSWQMSHLARLTHS